jgi:hypothetical protein
MVLTEDIRLFEGVGTEVLVHQRFGLSRIQDLKI